MQIGRAPLTVRRCGWRRSRTDGIRRCRLKAADADVTAAFAEALQANDIDVEVITVEGANHDNIVYATTEVGQATLDVMAEILINAR